MKVHEKKASKNADSIALVGGGSLLGKKAQRFDTLNFKRSSYHGRADW